jgi:hypothetical protein
MQRNAAFFTFGCLTYVNSVQRYFFLLISALFFPLFAAAGRALEGRMVCQNGGGPEQAPGLSVFYGVTGGPNGPVRAMEFDSTSGIIYVGGSFTSFLAGTTQGDGHVAGFNPNTNQWFEVAGGLPGAVNDLIFWNGTLYAGGLFTNTNGDEYGVARLGSNGWEEVGNLGGEVYCLQLYQNELYAGGNFALNGQGGQSAYIAKLLNDTWSSPGFTFNGVVKTMLEWQGMLVMGGEFNHSGLMPSLHVFGWNGTSGWAPGSPGAPVYSLEIFQGELYAAGPLLSGYDTFGLAKLQNNQWTNLISLEFFNNTSTFSPTQLASMGFWKIKSIENQHPDYFSPRQLYAIGNFLFQPQNPNSRPGQNMLRLDAGVGLTGDSFADSTVFDVIEINGTVYVAGLFSSINQTPAYYFGYSRQEATSIEIHNEGNGLLTAVPNPSAGRTLELRGLPESMIGQKGSLFNETGQALGELQLQPKHQVILGNLPPGTYFATWPNGQFVRFSLIP